MDDRLGGTGNRAPSSIHQGTRRFRQMKVFSTVWLALAILLAASGNPLMGQGSAAKAEGAKYVGVKMCGMCHRGEKRGSQLEIWKASGHAQAYQVLGTDRAKEVAAKAGVEGDPQESDQCLTCHVTAFGVDPSMLGAKFAREDGVQCEACHGPGSLYKRRKTMQDREAAVEAGLVIPDEKTCTGCHNEKSPTFKGFDFKAYFDKIAHPRPGQGG